MSATTMSITASDGHSLSCWHHPAPGQAMGGLVILQEIFGITDQLKGVAASYASQGFDVAMPALFDRVERHAVIPFDQAPKGREMMLSCDPDKVMADVAAAVDLLGGQQLPVAVLGFCWGGGLAVRAAQELDIAAAVSFYGTRLQNYLNQPLRAPVQGHFGSTDDHVPPELLDQFRQAFPETEIFMYDGGHAFANDARPSYVGAAAELAHQRSLAFLKKQLS